MNSDTTALVEQIAIWKKYKTDIYPEDILNLIIDVGMARLYEVNDIIEKISKIETEVTLPTNHIGEK